MQVNISEGGTKIQLLYVLWVLENFSDESNTLKQDDIVDILEKKDIIRKENLWQGI